jgi:hypothetical protein
LGKLVGGARGDLLVAEANAFFTLQQVEAEQVVALFAPRCVP